MREIGVSMTDLAQQLGVHKSDISHALSPRAKHKRYIKLRRRIEQALKDLRREYYQRNPLPNQRFGRMLDQLKKRMPRNWQHLPNDLYELLWDCAHHKLPPPPITLADAARVLGRKSRATLHRAIHNDPKLPETTRREALACLRLWGKWLHEDHSQ